MKKEIHPKWYPQATVKCNCGNTFKTGATVPEIEVDVCSACHSFFTGNQKLVDTTGRVTRYQARLEKSRNLTKSNKKANKKVKKTSKSTK